MIDILEFRSLLGMGNWPFDSRSRTTREAFGRGSRAVSRREDEPDELNPELFSPTDAIPGSQEKLRVLVERIESGLPLWHPADRVASLPIEIMASNIEQSDIGSIEDPVENAITIDLTAKQNPLPIFPHHIVGQDRELPEAKAGSKMDEDLPEHWRDLHQLFDFERLFGVRI